MPDKRGMRVYLIMKRLMLVFSLLIIFSISSQVLASNDISISLRVEPVFVSPNQDGINDLVFFYPVLPSNLDVARWRLDVFNQKGRRVQRLSGVGVNSLIKWDLKDKNQNIVIDGAYSVRYDIWSDAGHFHVEPDPFFVDTQAPLVEVGISTSIINQAGAEILVTPVVQDDSATERWQCQVLNQLGRTVDIEWSTGPVSTISWTGVDKKTGVLFPRGEYSAVYQVWDKAGNQSETVHLRFQIEATPSESLKSLLNHILVYETPLGLITPLSAQDLFVKKKGKPVLSSRGEAMLKELALLINSYPENSVRLDGYSLVKKKAQQSRDMSSAYAWSVYSYLVKVGGVKGSRLLVRGRGKSPMFERRSIEPPVVSDGVDVIIEGNQKW